MKNVFKNYFPITFLLNNKLLIFKRGTFFILDVLTSKTRKLTHQKLSLKDRLTYTLPLLHRIFRKGIRCSINITDNIVAYVIGNTIYELDLVDRSISLGYTTEDKSRPLAFSIISEISGFEDGIYFGGYMSNSQKKPISIYKRVSTDYWTKVYQFPEGTIEHIHNIVADRFSDTVFILTGDFNKSAGIWIAKNDFSTIAPILIGKQNYRACIAFPSAKGLVYATDGPFSENSIRILKKNNENQWRSEKIQSINGPCIYGCKWKDDIVFSTSVEGDGRNTNLFYKLFGRKMGVGIKTDFSYIYKGNSEKGFKVVYKTKKDILPFYLFQFGVLMFPSGHNRTDCLPVYHIATNKHSMNTLILQA